VKKRSLIKGKGLPKGEGKRKALGGTLKLWTEGQGGRVEFGGGGEERETRIEEGG